MGRVRREITKVEIEESKENKHANACVHELKEDEAEAEARLKVTAKTSAKTWTRKPLLMSQIKVWMQERQGPLMIGLV